MKRWICTVRIVALVIYTAQWSSKEATLDEMREHLQMSKPSMSAGVKKLQEFDIVKQQFTRGSRKQHFIAEKLLPFFRNFFTQKWEREVDTNLEAVEKAQLLLDETLKMLT